MPPEQPDILSNLNSRFAIPGIAAIVPGNGNLPKIQITAPAASAEIYLHGAQVTSWHPAGESEVIFLSRQSHWESGKAVRGGIPICFPWFRAKSDNPKAPSHGVVRTKAWQLQSLTLHESSVVIALTTESDEESQEWWPHEFQITHKISVGKALSLELIVENTGSSPFSFEEALHTYNRVGNVEQLQIIGLDATHFLDNRDSNLEKLQQGEIILTRDTDNAYIDTQNPVEILDPVLDRRIRLEKENSSTTIVWNPWKEDAAKLADLGDDEWPHFACVEASNILSASIILQPGQQHTMSATISVTSGGS